MYPVLIALVQWGEQWEGSPGGARIVLTARTDGQPLPPIQVRDRACDPLTHRQVVANPGPATSEPMRRLYTGDWRKT